MRTIKPILKFIRYLADHWWKVQIAAILSLIFWGFLVLKSPPTIFNSSGVSNESYLYIYAGPVEVAALLLLLFTFVGIPFSLFLCFIKSRNILFMLGDMLVLAIFMFFMLAFFGPYLSQNFFVQASHIENRGFDNHQYALMHYEDMFTYQNTYVLFKCNRWMVLCRPLYRVENAPYRMMGADFRREPIPAHIEINDDQIDLVVGGEVVYTYDP